MKTSKFKDIAVAIGSVALTLVVFIITIWLYTESIGLGAVGTILTLLLVVFNYIEYLERNHKLPPV